MPHAQHCFIFKTAISLHLFNSDQACALYTPAQYILSKSLAHNPSTRLRRQKSWRQNAMAIRISHHMKRLLYRSSLPDDARNCEGIKDMPYEVPLLASVKRIIVIGVANSWNTMSLDKFGITRSVFTESPPPQTAPCVQYTRDFCDSYRLDIRLFGNAR